jgi:hypothetical protein
MFTTSSNRPTIYLLAEMLREVRCPRREAEKAFLQDCPEEREFIRMVLDELYGPRRGAGGSK